MAEVQPLPEIYTLKNSDILVHVEEALLDFLVVSYEYDSRLYQGILLDASKRALPCGIIAPPGFPEIDSSNHGLGIEEDRMHSVAQRYSYFQGKSPPQTSSSTKDSFLPGSAYLKRRAMRGGLSKFKNNRMTVRLRPRQVLCSKCKSICNENSENVDLSRKRKGEESCGSANSSGEKRNCTSRQLSPKSPRPPFSENPQDNTPMTSLSGGKRQNSSNIPGDAPPLRSLLPKAVQESELSESLNSNSKKFKIAGGYWIKKPDSKLETESKRKANSSRNNKAVKHCGFGSSSWDAVRPAFISNKNDSTEASGPAKTSSDSLETASPICKEVDIDTRGGQVDSLLELKSSSGSSEADESQERMVLRKKKNVGSMEDLWDENVFLEDTTRRTTPVIKISFGSQGEGTVLKIPAKVRSYHESESDEEEKVERVHPEAHSKDARAKAAKRALKKAKKEARKKDSEEDVGSSSISFGITNETPLYQRRRKRKDKHKKRHKGIHVHNGIHPEGNEIDVEIASQFEKDPLKLDDNVANEELAVKNVCDYVSMKEKCLKQKLSISLKRLNANAYARCGGTSSSTGSDSPASNSDLSSADDVPDFPGPPQGHAFMTVGSCLTGDGRTMEVGDVVWGKIHGFPWWPGKVLSITVQRKEDGVAFCPQAHVAWYGSSTSSLMPCDQLSPFLETFKTRYNKKKRGPYKEAIRQATCEAQKDFHDSLQEIDVVT